MLTGREGRIMFLFLSLVVLLIFSKVYFWMNNDKWSWWQPKTALSHAGLQEEQVFLGEQIRKLGEDNQRWMQDLENGLFNHCSQVNIIRCEHYLKVARSKIEEAKEAIRKNSSTEAIGKLLEVALTHLVLSEIGKSFCDEPEELEKIWRYLNRSYSALDSAGRFLLGWLAKEVCLG